MPRLAPGEASGGVMTTVMTDRSSCSETVTSSYPGNGMAPRIAVREAGNACPAGSPSIMGSAPSVIPAGPVPQTEPVSYPPAR